MPMYATYSDVPWPLLSREALARRARRLRALADGYRRKLETRVELYWDQGFEAGWRAGMARGERDGRIHERAAIAAWLRAEAAQTKAQADAVPFGAAVNGGPFDGAPLYDTIAGAARLLARYADAIEREEHRKC